MKKLNLLLVLAALMFVACDNENVPSDELAASSSIDSEIITTTITFTDACKGYNGNVISGTIVKVKTKSVVKHTQKTLGT